MLGPTCPNPKCSVEKPMWGGTLCGYWVCFRSEKRTDGCGETVSVRAAKIAMGGLLAVAGGPCAKQEAQ